MNKNRLIKYSAVLLASALMIGCTTSERVDEIIDSISNNPQNQLPNSGGTFINDDLNQSNSTSSGEIKSDENATTGTIKIDAKNAYKVAATFSDEYNKVGYYSRGEIGSIKFDITNIYTKNFIDTSKIESIVLKAQEQIDENGTKSGKYFNFITYDGKEGPNYEIPTSKVKASDTVALKIKEFSGTTNLILSVNLKGFDQPYNLKVPLVIEKNKSSSMAIVPIGSKYENGLFIDKFVIHVVDSYGNKAKDGTRISAGVVNNPKLYSKAYNGGTSEIGGVAQDVDDQTLPRNRYKDVSKVDYNFNYTSTKQYDDNNESYTVFSLIENRTVNYTLKNDTGTLDRSNSTFTLPANSIDTTKDTITSLDTLIVLANKEQHKPYNLGGWDISSINSDHEISLYNLNGTENLTGVSYVIGDEYRYDSCNDTIMNAAASTFTSTEVKDGLAYAELRYVPAMVGKNVFIYANSQLDNKRIGISRKILLTGTGLEPGTFSCKNETKKGSGYLASCSERFRMIQKDSKKIARNVYVSQPTTVGISNYAYATISRTNCDGWATVSVYGVPPEKTATVTFGDFISNELIVNQK